MKEWTLHQLMAWLRGRSNMLVCVTGPTGGGKSTLVGNLGAKLAYKVAMPGRIVRERPELLKKVINSKNPTAVPELEKFVRQHVITKLQKAGEGRCVAIDGMPRTIEQVTFCIDLALDFGKTLVFLYLDVSRPEREKRLHKRGGAGDAKLMVKRLDNDELVMPLVQSRIANAVFGGRFGYFFLVNTGGQCEEKEIRAIEGEPDTEYGNDSGHEKAVL